MSDNVKNPAHYTSGGIECIDAIRASMGAEEFQGYCKGNALKYLWRWRQKGGVEDLRKASVYLGWLIESAEGREEKPSPTTIYPWDYAPPEATHAAMDADGLSYWYSQKPIRNDLTKMWEVCSISQMGEPNIYPGDWKESLEARP
jgi:hypothetical protein